MENKKFKVWEKKYPMPHSKSLEELGCKTYGPNFQPKSLSSTHNNEIL